VVERLEEKPSLDPVARGEVDMPSAPRKGLDQCEDLVMCQRLRAHNQPSPETDGEAPNAAASGADCASRLQL
jgi:hypothetical protein